MNRLIMNYLVIEGYKDAAESFATETGLRPPGDLSSIQGRMEIRRAVQNGRVVEAIEMVNELNPEVRECPRGGAMVRALLRRP